MALGMSFYSVVIPISNFEKCKDIRSLKEAMERAPITGARTNDDYLFKESVMGTYGVEMLVDFWRSQGLTPYVEINNKMQWKDLCVVEAHSGATAECEWIEYDRETLSVWLKGKPKGEIIRTITQKHQVSDADVFEKLKRLEQLRVISLGVDRNRANKYMFNSTVIGKILNLLTYVGIGFLIFFVFNKEFSQAVISLLLVGMYSVIVQKVATYLVRYRALSDIKSFDEIYDSKTLTIRINSNKEIIHSPMYWRSSIIDVLQSY